MCESENVALWCRSINEQARVIITYCTLVMAGMGVAHSREVRMRAR